MRRLFFVFLAILPSFLKVWLLRRLGHEIGNDVHIGMAYLDVKKIVLGDNAYIGSLNYFKGLKELVLEEHARIGGWGNWFTANAFDYQGNPGHGCIVIGRGSAITNRHYFDIQDSLIIGEQTFIAGFGSVFYTHGVSPPLGNFNREVVIGPHCYIGSHCLFLPGAEVGAYTFVGAGSVVTKDFSKHAHVLVAGNPAQVKKSYDPRARFFVEDHTAFLPSPQYRPARTAVGGSHRDVDHR